MSALPQRKATSAETATVAPFLRLVNESSTTVSSSASDIALLPSLASELGNKVKEIVDAWVAEHSIQESIRLASTDNPFDPVYISKLQPDVLDSSDAALLGKFKDIQDASAQIIFNDGWDD